MKIKTLFPFLLVFVLPYMAHARERDWTLTGYVKDLFMYYFPEQPDGLHIDDQYTNTLHNRLNFEWFATNKLTVVIENRNRLIGGNMIRNFPAYQSTIEADPGYLDLSVIPFEGDSWFLHCMIDRAYLDWTSGSWQIRIGRQRVNWGVNLVWNPNDIFNTFSYFDFDYEERPGTDAVRIQYYTGATSSAELVYKLGENSNEMALAGLYRFSHWNYDFQLMGGWVGPDMVAGFGWAGDIKGAGFRGEFSQFIPRQSGSDSQSATVASVSADYTFPSSFYIHFSALFNSLGKNGMSDLNPIFSSELSAKSLAYGKYELFGQCSYPVTPLLNANISAIGNAADGSMYLGPSVNYSLQPNIELMLTAQFFLGDENSEYGNIGQLAFARIKWSF
jgi:hypothetical protein